MLPSGPNKKAVIQQEHRMGYSVSLQHTGCWINGCWNMLANSLTLQEEVKVVTIPWRHDGLQQMNDYLRCRITFGRRGAFADSSSKRRGEWLCDPVNKSTISLAGDDDVWPVKPPRVNLANNCAEPSTPTHIHTVVAGMQLNSTSPIQEVIQVPHEWN